MTGDEDEDPTLRDADLELLAGYLHAPDQPDEVMTLAELDGFLAAIAIGPEPIDTGEWLPIIWDYAEPNFTGESLAKAVFRAIVSHYNDIVRAVAAGAYEPILDVDEDDAPVPQGWAFGFMTATGLRLPAWTTLLQSEQDDVLAYPILAFCEDESGNPLFDIPKRDRAYLETNASELIAQAVADIAGYWQQKNKPLPTGAVPVRTTPKIGRNDPCPCGSGKKHKKCCGA